MSAAWSALLASHSPVAHASANARLILIPLPGMASLQITGPDTCKFLQGQCTTDFREVESGQILPGAICSLKGRALFTYRAIPAADTVHLVLPQDQLTDTHAHLKKFSIFSKVTLTADAGTPLLLGLRGPDAASALARLSTELPAQGRTVTNPAGIIIAALPDTDRYLLIMPQEQAQNALDVLLAAPAVVATEADWLLADIRAGLASVSATTRDQFQPQELNYPAVSGVSYNKGCYTGQEVVARLYFRGKLKQRLYRLSAAAGTIEAGSGIYAGEQLVGSVVNAASSGDNQSELLAIVKNAAIAAGQLALGQNGPALTVLDLPYALDKEKEE
ncbi:MAG: hypothetical protein WBJ03_02005 [Moraxellaceae bacterium]